MAKEKVALAIGGREVSISSPSKVYFPKTGQTKLELVRYYLSVADGALRGAGGRPNVMKRWVDGAGGEFFFQKRAPATRPEWLDVVELSFPSGRTAEEVVPRDAAALAWMVNLGCIDLNPHGVRADDLDHPDELRVDLDPVPGIEWPQIVAVARVVHETLDAFGLVGWPKTSGSRGIHVNVRIAKRWTFDEVRRAALAFAREVERRAPTIATAKWWKEERHGVFLDYNQNAKDRTVASGYSIRPTDDARASAPVTWAELDTCDPHDFTLATMPARFAAIGDPHAGIDDAVCSLETLLELSKKQESDGQVDAPWPPHYAKQEGEPTRVAPSRARKLRPVVDGETTQRQTSSTAGSQKEGGGRERSGRRRSKFPLVEIARSRTKEEGLAAFEVWKGRHAAIAPLLEPADILVDAMRGRYTTWTRVRVNLQHVPEADRPAQEALIVDYDPFSPAGET